ALGVAVLGSVLAQVYRSQLSPHLGNLPAAARDAATGSITASQAAAARLGPGGPELAPFPDPPFGHALHVTTPISAARELLREPMVMRWMPGRAAAPAAGPAPSGGTTAAAPAPAVAPARKPLPASEAPLAEAASVNGEASLDGAAAPDGAAWPNGTAAPNGAAARNGQGAAAGAARRGGSAPMEG